MIFFLFLLILVLLAAGTFTYVHLPRPSGSQPPSIWHVLLVTVLTMGTLGFGACGGFGSFVGISIFLSGSRPDVGLAALFIVPGVLGVLVAAALGVLAYRQWHPARPKTASNESDA